MDLLKKTEIARTLSDAGFKSNGSAFAAISGIVNQVVSSTIENIDKTTKVVHSDEILEGWQLVVLKISKLAKNEGDISAEILERGKISHGIRTETLSFARSLDEYITEQSQIESKPGGRELPETTELSADAEQQLSECRTRSKEFCIQLDKFIDQQIATLTDSLGNSKSTKTGKKRKL